MDTNHFRMSKLNYYLYCHLSISFFKIRACLGFSKFPGTSRTHWNKRLDWMNFEKATLLNPFINHQQKV